MSVCSYYALFKININHKWFNYNRMFVKATTGAALMQVRPEIGCMHAYEERGVIFHGWTFG
jgi:hypothetical protein